MQPKIIFYIAEIIYYHYYSGFNPKPSRVKTKSSAKDSITYIG